MKDCWIRNEISMSLLESSGVTILQSMRAEEFEEMRRRMVAEISVHAVQLRETIGKTAICVIDIDKRSGAFYHNIIRICNHRFIFDGVMFEAK